MLFGLRLLGCILKKMMSIYFGHFNYRNGWLQEAMSHMTFVVSQGEYQVHRFLRERDIRFETQKRFPDCKDITYLPFNFYLPDFNLLIEYQGVQHVEGYRRDKLDAVNMARRDAIKKSFAIDNVTAGCPLRNILACHTPYAIRHCDCVLMPFSCSIWTGIGHNQAKQA
ncbi:hypothetical protein MCERE10_02221 [Burkholderiaceae bacterium]